MENFIAFLFLILGVSGMGIISMRRSPDLIGRSIEKEGKVKKIFFAVRKRIGDYFKNFSIEKILHKILSKVRVFLLKIESKSEHLLRKLRERIINKK